MFTFTIGLLSAGGAYLLIEFRAQQQDLQQLVSTLEERVQERTTELERALERALQADQIKSQFLASMSHELRTPLNAILNFSRFNVMGVYGELTERQHDSLNKIIGSAEHLLALINDVLDVAKIEAGMMQLFIEDNVDLNAELETAVASAETLLAAKPVELNVDIDAQLPLIVADKRRLRQIVLNLVSNACKFTATGSVTISAKQRDEHIHVAVLDTGPGIPQDKLDLIFEPFQQTDTGIKHSGGTGLGLPIAKRLVEAHQGRIWVASVEGEGSAFHVDFPVRSARLLQHLQASEAGEADEEAQVHV